MQTAKNMRVVEKATKRVYEGFVHEETNMFVGPDITVSLETINSDFTHLIDSITSLSEYQKLAARTLPDLREIYGTDEVIIIGIEELNCNDIHTLYGITTELGEILDLYKKSFAYRKVFDKTNLIEEICDMMWYIAAGCTMNSIDLNKVIDFESIKFNGFCIPLGNFPTIENMKAVYELIHDFNNSTIDVEDVIAAFVPSKEEFLKGLTNNINKLIIRYPYKFTNLDAINRDLDSERSELEK